MHQQSYFNDVLKRFDMEDCKPVDTPFDPHIRPCKSGVYDARAGLSSRATQGESTVSDAKAAKFKKKKSKVGTEDKVPYRELIGCLVWISMGTRPYVSYAVNQ